MTVIILKLLREIFNDLKEPLNAKTNQARSERYILIDKAFCRLEKGSDPLKQKKLTHLVLAAMTIDIQEGNNERSKNKLPNFYGSKHKIPIISAHTLETLDAYGAIILSTLVKNLQVQSDFLESIKAFYPQFSINYKNIRCLLTFCDLYQAHLETKSIDVHFGAEQEEDFDELDNPFADELDIDPRQARQAKTNCSCARILSSPISMMVVSGFITALGLTAIVLAFTLLNASTLGIATAVVGTLALVAGIQFFTQGVYDNKRETEPLEYKL